MPPKITEKELDLLDAHLHAAEQILTELKKKSVEIRQSLSLTDNKPPSKYMLRKARDAQKLAEFLAYLQLLSERKAQREQRKQSKP